jgi:hypothetical protein
MTLKMYYVDIAFTMKMNSSDKISCGDIVNNQNIDVLK